MLEKHPTKGMMTNRNRIVGLIHRPWPSLLALKSLLGAQSIACSLHQSDKSRCFSGSITSLLQRTINRIAETYVPKLSSYAITPFQYPAFRARFGHLQVQRSAIVVHS